jgi:hypothetical protein
VRLDRFGRYSRAMAVVAVVLLASPLPGARVASASGASAGGALPALCPALVAPATWSTKALGSADTEYGDAVAVDTGICAIFTGGQTFGALTASPAIGSGDGFVARYSTTGALVWLEQFGTTSQDGVNAMAVDVDHNVYVVGKSAGTMPGSPMLNLGGYDMFIAKYDQDGTAVWTRQLGSTMHDYGTGVAITPGGDVFVSGWTEGTLIGVSAGGRDFFLARYDVDGNLVMLIQDGTSASDLANGVAVGPAGNAYVVGETSGALGAVAYGLQDIFVAKYDASGAQIWLDQRGTPQMDVGEGIAVSADGTVFVAGASHGDLDGGVNQGALDVVVMKYDASGIWRWTDERGTSGTDMGKAIAVGPNGAPYTTGFTGGNLDGNVSAGSTDAFVMKHGRGGAWQWTTQLGTPLINYGSAIAVDSSEHPYVSGEGGGAFGGIPNQGYYDAFVVKLDSTGILR